MKIFIVTLNFVFSSWAMAGSVIANNDVSLTSAEVKDVFTGEKQSAGNVKLTLVDNQVAIADFVSKVLGMESGKYTAMWAKKSFRDGVPLPKTKSSDSEVSDFVKSTSGAIGYVSGATPSGLKEISKF